VLPVLVQLGEQFRKIVVRDRRCRLGERRGLPERHLLQPDQVGLLGEDLLGQAFRPGREVVVDDFAQDLPIGGAQFFGSARFDRRHQIGAEVEVAGHRVEGLATATEVAVVLAVMAVRFGLMAVTFAVGPGGGGEEQREGECCGNRERQKPAGRHMSGVQGVLLIVVGGDASSARIGQCPKPIYGMT